MGLIMNDGAEAPVAAKQMMKEHPNELEMWLKDVKTIDGKPGLEKVKAHLGITK